jgi:hypothetical protein
VLPPEVGIVRDVVAIGHATSLVSADLRRGEVWNAWRPRKEAYCRGKVKNRARAYAWLPFGIMPRARRFHSASVTLTWRTRCSMWEGESLALLGMDGLLELKSIQILHQPVYHVGTLSLDQPLLTALLTALNNRS